MNTPSSGGSRPRLCGVDCLMNVGRSRALRVDCRTTFEHVRCGQTALSRSTSPRLPNTRSGSISSDDPERYDTHMGDVKQRIRQKSQRGRDGRSMTRGSGTCEEEGTIIRIGNCFSHAQKEKRELALDQIGEYAGVARANALVLPRTWGRSVVLRRFAGT